MTGGRGHRAYEGVGSTGAGWGEPPERWCGLGIWFTPAGLYKVGLTEFSIRIARTGDEWVGGQAPGLESPMVGRGLLIFNNLPGILMALETESP